MTSRELIFRAKTVTPIRVLMGSLMGTKQQMPVLTHRLEIKTKTRRLTSAARLPSFADEMSAFPVSF
ncbi:MAG: hypothetical protein ACRCUY_08565 [Thermoguttaceae bacterium]